MTRRLPRVSKQDGQPLESTIQAQVVHALRRLGWVVWEMQKGSRGNGAVYCTPGIPDLYVFNATRALWLELKRPGTGRLSPAQKERHHELTVCGLPVFTVTSLDEARAALTAPNPAPETTHDVLTALSAKYAGRKA